MYMTVVNPFSLFIFSVKRFFLLSTLSIKKEASAVVQQKKELKIWFHRRDLRRRTEQLHSTELYNDGISTIRWDCHITHIFFFTTMRQDDDDDGVERSENSQAKIVSWINFYPMRNFSLCKRARILKNSSYFLHCHWLCNCISAYLSSLGAKQIVCEENWEKMIW